MWARFKQDALRWVVPGQVAHPAALTWPLLIKLLIRHVPLRAMAWYRLGAWCKANQIPLLTGLLQRHLFFRFGLEIGGEIEGGLYIAHASGTVINVEHMGENCSVIASVTIGMRNEWVFPVIGNHVFIGAGARILGGLTIGDHAKIGANAVVMHDIPAQATAVGVPARVIKQPTLEQTTRQPASSNRIAQINEQSNCLARTDEQPVNSVQSLHHV